MNNLTLESRIAHLEKLLNYRRSRKNEDDRERISLVNACKTLYESLNYLNDMYRDDELYDMMELFTAFCNNHGVTEKDLGLV